MIEHPLIFISHSSHDIEVAKLTATLLRAALNLTPEAIRCTSVDGYRLPIGADTVNQLREEVLSAEAFIGIISNKSLSSAYVLFELGARWGAKKPLFPLLASGVEPGLLVGPLSGINALSCGSEEELHQLLGDLGRTLRRKINLPSAYLSELRLLQGVGASRSPRESVGSSAVEAPGNADIGEPHKAILRLYRDWSHEHLDLRTIQNQLKWSLPRARYFVEELIQGKYIKVTKSGEWEGYSLSNKGRALVVKEGLA